VSVEAILMTRLAFVAILGVERVCMRRRGRGREAGRGLGVGEGWGIRYLAYEIHAYEMHVHEVYPHGMHAREIHAREVQINHKRPHMGGRFVLRVLR
jgi:hypothetical protein